MSLVKSIDRLINDIPEPVIRNRLVALRKRAERVEIALKQSQVALKRSEANLKECRSELERSSADFKRLKLEVEKKKLPSDQDSLDESERQLVMLLARSGGTTWISEIEAQHHADKLADKFFASVGPAMYRRGKTHVLVSLTDKGRAYVARNKLA